MILGETVRNNVFEQNLSRRWEGGRYPRTVNRGVEQSAVPTQIRSSHRLHRPAITIRSLTCRQQLRKTTHRLSRSYITRPKLRVRMEVPDFLPSLWWVSIGTHSPQSPSFLFTFFTETVKDSWCWFERLCHEWRAIASSFTSPWVRPFSFLPCCPLDPGHLFTPAACSLLCYLLPGPKAVQTDHWGQALRLVSKNNERAEQALLKLQYGAVHIHRAIHA